MTMALASGCGSKSPSVSSPVPKAPPEESAEESKRLYTKSGEATVRDPKGVRPVLYVVRWKSTQFDYTLEDGFSKGRLEGASGELYQDGKLASTFTADTAFADKSANLLMLEGNVTVVGRDPKGTLRGNKLEWKTDTKTLKARGSVTIDLPEGRIGPVDELWCLPDLKRAGTPGFFGS